MSHRICLASDPLRSGFPTDKSALWVHHKSDAPLAEQCVEVDEFVANPRRYYAGVDVVVLLNLVSKVIRPGSRMKYGQFLTDPWVGPQRLSVDTHAFIGDPWRMWFHFGAVDAPFGEPSEKYHTSFRVETDWKFWLEGKLSEQPCNIARIKRFGEGVLVFRDGFRFDEVSIDVVEADVETKAAYAREKEAAFAECRTSAALIKRLGAFAQLRCPGRSFTELHGSRSIRIVATDLGIDRWLVSQAKLSIDLTNSIAEAFDGR